MDGGTNGREDGSEGDSEGGFDDELKDAVNNAFSGRADAVFQGRDFTYNDHRVFTPAERPIPYQVPSCTPRFVNRSDELAVLDGLFGAGGGAGEGNSDGNADGEGGEAGSPRVVVLSGLPGVGKSATARRWAERARGRFPGGQLYVDFADLRGHTGGSDVSGGLAAILRALGVDENFLPTTLAERTKLFRSLTAEHGVLIVLDDVTHPAHVSALVPGAPGSAVVVTSNQRLGDLLLDGAHLMPLDPLDAAAGSRLLADLCGEHRVRAEPEAAARLVEQCAGLPVALHVAASRLAAHRRLTLAALVAELSAHSGALAALRLGSGEDERGVPMIFDVACRDLPDDAARLYRRLGLLPGRTFDADTAAVAAGGDPGTAQALLDTLDAASLLEDAPGGRYRLHPLVRLHAQALAEEHEPEAEREALLSRVVDHFVAYTAFADRAVMGNRLRITDHDEVLAGHTDPFTGDDPRNAALSGLESVRADALAVLRAAVRHGLDRRAWQLAESLTALYLHHRHLTDWIESGDLGAAAAARTGDRAAEARLRSLVSRPLMDIGATDRARTESESAVRLADASGHLVLRASVREFAGRYWDHVDPRRAIGAYEHSLALNLEAGEPRGAALARFFMGRTQDACGDHERALVTLLEAYEQLLALGDTRMAGRALAAVGRAQDHLGREAEAVRSLERAADILRERRATHYEAEAREELAAIATRSDDHAATRRHLTRALEIHEAGGSPRAEVLRDRLRAVEE